MFTEPSKMQTKRQLGGLKSIAIGLVKLNFIEGCFRVITYTVIKSIIMGKIIDRSLQSFTFNQLKLYIEERLSAMDLDFRTQIPPCPMFLPTHFTERQDNNDARKRTGNNNNRTCDDYNTL